MLRSNLAKWPIPEKASPEAERIVAAHKAAGKARNLACERATSK
jgi:hypothetical protein